MVGGLPHFRRPHPEKIVVVEEMAAEVAHRMTLRNIFCCAWRRRALTDFSSGAPES
jgi:hypothetical protein